MTSSVSVGIDECDVSPWKSGSSAFTSLANDRDKLKKELDEAHAAVYS